MLTCRGSGAVVFGFRRCYVLALRPMLTRAPRCLQLQWTTNGTVSTTYNPQWHTITYLICVTCSIVVEEICEDWKEGRHQLGLAAYM